MDWTSIVWAIVLAGMLVMIFPRMRRAMQDSPEGSSSDWMSALIPIALVAGFVALLIMMV